MAHVAGYCVINDLSERAYQLERGGQWDKGKGCDTFAPIGPWLVTADEVPDPQALDLWPEVDGHRFQDGNTSMMIFGVARLVSYISQFMSLQPGDLISTGTPRGSDSVTIHRHICGRDKRYGSGFPGWACSSSRRFRLFRAKP